MSSKNLSCHKLPGAESRLSGTDSLSLHTVIFRTDNMAVVSHINHQGGSWSRTLNRHAHRLLLWAQDKFLSLRAVHVLGVLNLTAVFLSRQKLRSGVWMLNRQTVAQILDLYCKAEVDLFASQESSHCPLWISLSSPVPLGIDAFAHPWPDMRLYAFQPVKLIPAVLCRVNESGVRLLLVALFWPSQTWFSELIPLLYRFLGRFRSGRTCSLNFRARSGTLNPRSGSCGFWLLVFLLRFRRLSLVPEPPPLGSCTLPNGRSLCLGV